MRNTIKTLALALILSFWSWTTSASNVSGDTGLTTFSDPADVPVDPGASPINDCLIPMLVLGVALGYRLLRKKTQEV